MTEATGMEVALPHTGELVSLEDPRACAKALNDWRELKTKVRAQVEPDLERTLLFESEKQGSKTLRFGNLTVEIKTTNVILWDFDKLEELRDAGLPEERYDDLVKAKVEYTVSVRVADQLSAANPEYKRIIDAAKHPREGTHRVNVVRS